MHCRTVNSLSSVDPMQWNALGASDNPFLRHEFLHTLEEFHCASKASGWQAHHLLVEDDRGNLLGAAPLYLKTHSYGEFVFDFSWAEASHRLGQPYYPKLLNAVPFNPVTGPRLLAADAGTRRLLINGIRQQLAQLGLSSAHALFLDPVDRSSYADAGFLLRKDCHFHWLNPGFVDFEDFLDSLDGRRRKEIRRERRKVADAGIQFEVLSGAALPDALWPQVYACYARTYQLRGQPPYLSFDCLKAIGTRLGQEVRLFLARREGVLIAAAYMMQSGDTLYGRHWGCLEEHDGLHFELCYYQGIDYCIQHKLARFDAGAQGEHKLRRGFVPMTTWSAHWLSNERLYAAVAAYLERESLAIDDYIEQVSGKYAAPAREAQHAKL